MVLPRQNKSLTTEYLNQYSGDTVEIIAALFIVLNTLFLVLRFYARFLTKVGLGLDDLCLSIGYGTNIALCVVSILMVKRGGVGQHMANLEITNPALIVGWAKGLYAVELIYLSSVALAKLTILFFYLRIFTTRGSLLISRGTAILVAANWAAFVVACFFQCTPISFWWDKTLPGGRCFNVQAFYRIMCVPNLVTDIIVMALPIRSIMKLKLPTINKIALIIIFLTASVGLVASIIRFTIFFDTEAFTDSTWSSVRLIGWSIVESGMYLIAACLPLLRPVFAKHTPAIIKKVFTTRTEMFRLEPSKHSTNGFKKLSKQELISAPNSSTVEGSVNCSYKQKLGPKRTQSVSKHSIEVVKEVSVQHS